MNRPPRRYWRGNVSFSAKVLLAASFVPQVRPAALSPVADAV